VYIQVRMDGVLTLISCEQNNTDPGPASATGELGSFHPPGSCRPLDGPWWRPVEGVGCCGLPQSATRLNNVMDWEVGSAQTGSYGIGFSPIVKPHRHTRTPTVTTEDHIGIIRHTYKRCVTSH